MADDEKDIKITKEGYIDESKKDRGKGDYFERIQGGKKRDKTDYIPKMQAPDPWPAPPKDDEE